MKLAPSRAIRQAEVGAARTMIERAQDRFGLYPERLAADSAYGSAEMLAWLVHERGIEPHIPVLDNSQRLDGTFERADFTYDHKADAYICPTGKELRQRQKTYRMPLPLVDENGMMRYRASKLDCNACSLKPQCCPNAPARSAPSRVLAIWRAISPPRTPMSPQGANGRRSRCCSRTSNASSGSIGYDYEDRTVPVTSSILQPPLRTSGNSQSSSRCWNRNRHDPRPPRASARNRQSSASLIADFFNGIGATRSLAEEHGPILTKKAQIRYPGVTLRPQPRREDDEISS